MTQVTQVPATRTRAQIAAKTLRKDPWWRSPAINATFLALAVIYLTVAAFWPSDYFWKPYISPLDSPCLATTCTSGAGFSWIPWVSGLTPAILIIWGPMGFRFTCYYYRKAYYRAFWQSPPACGVREPHAKYTGETRLPLILQNVHRYFFYVALLFNVILTADAVVAFRRSRRPVGPYGPRHADADRQRGAAVALLAVLPRLPTRHRRPAEALLQAPGQVQGVDLGVEVERQAYAAGLDLARLRVLHRPVHQAGGQRRVRRPAVLLDEVPYCHE